MGEFKSLLFLGIAFSLGYGLRYVQTDNLQELDAKHPCIDFMLQDRDGGYYLKQRMCLNGLGK